MSRLVCNAHASSNQIIGSRSLYSCSLSTGPLQINVSLSILSLDPPVADGHHSAYSAPDMVSKHWGEEGKGESFLLSVQNGINQMILREI